MGPPLSLDELTRSPAAVPVADWRLPSSELEGYDRSGKETVWLRIYAWFFLFAGLAYYFLIASMFDVRETIFITNVEVMAMVALSQVALHVLYWRMSNKVVLGFGLKRLSAKVPGDGACPVALEIFQSGVVTGYDEGFMWIHEDTLYYKGLQTVFRVNSPDVLKLSLWPRGHRPNLDEGRVPRWIDLEVTGSTMWIHIKLIDPFEDYGARRRTAEFDRKLARWLHDRPTGSLESKLPPTRVHPALRPVARTSREGLIAGSTLIAVNLLLVFTTHWDRLTTNLADFGDAIPFVVSAVLLIVAVRMTLQIQRSIKVRSKLEVA